MARLPVMTVWKPHSLAKPHANQIELRRGDRVVSTIELEGVPSGTPGKVLMANGFNWLRYRVLFTNGAEVNDLDGRQLAPAGRTAQRITKAAERGR